MTQNNLGNTLQLQGIRTGGEDSTRQSAAAITAYRNALTIRTKTDHPVHWARTQENLARVEEAMADHAATTEALPHLKAALARVDAPLTVYDPEHMSYDYGKATALRERLLSKLKDQS